MAFAVNITPFLCRDLILCKIAVCRLASPQCSDDVKAVVGTINLDYRSLYHHFECGTYLYKTDCIPDIERDFQATMVMCREVTPETIRDETLYYKLMGNLMKFFAPLM